MWIKLTNNHHEHGNKKILVNVNNITYILTGQGQGYEGVTLVSFLGDEDNFITVDETVEEIEEIIKNAAEVGDQTDMSMTLNEAIEHAEDIAISAIGCECREEHRQLAEWLRILKKAKFEYDEAWRILKHPTPDVTYADRDRAQTILDVFRDSLGRLE